MLTAWAPERGTVIYYETSVVRVHWDSEFHGVWAEWLGFAADDEFRRPLMEGYSLFVEKKSGRWLADTRNLGPMTQEDQEWLNSSWFPLMIKAGMRAMAIIVPRRVVTQMSVKRVMSKIDGKELATSYFDALEDARRWLKSYR
jgi:hypothetical protein